MPHDIPTGAAAPGSSSSAPDRAVSRPHAWPVSGATGSPCWRRCRGPADRCARRRATRAADLLGIVEWRVAELAVSASTSATTRSPRPPTSLALDPDVVIVATGGLPQLPELDEGADRLVTSWDVLGGDVTPTGDVLLFDDNGTHSAMSAAEMIARSGASLEIVTPERMLGIEVGGMNHVPYARAFNETDTRITLNQRVRAVRPEAGRLCVEIGSDHTPTAPSVTSTGSSPTTAPRPAPSCTSSCARRRPTTAPSTTPRSWQDGRRRSCPTRRHVPAVPDRRRRRQSQHPRRRVRRPPPTQRSVGPAPLTFAGVKRPILTSAALVAAGTLAFPVLISAQGDPAARPDAAANTYGSVEPIPNPAVIDTGPLRDQSLAVKEAFAERSFECGVVDEVIDALTSSGAVSTIDDLNTSFDVAAGGFAGATNPAFVYIVVDSGPNSASTADIETLTNSLGYVLSQGSAFLLDGDNPEPSPSPPTTSCSTSTRRPRWTSRRRCSRRSGGSTPSCSRRHQRLHAVRPGYLSLQSDVPDPQQFIDGYVEAAARPAWSTPRSSMACLACSWVAPTSRPTTGTEPEGEAYLGRIPDASHDELAEIHDDHLRTTRDALRIVDRWSRHGDRFEGHIIRALERLRCRY